MQSRRSNTIGGSGIRGNDRESAITIRDRQSCETALVPAGMSAIPPTQARATIRIETGARPR